MATIRPTTRIRAPIRVCFDLAREVRAHLGSARSTKERIVAGRTSGYFELGDVVTWEATHLGVRQRLTAQVTWCEPPHVFEDVMRRGAFAHFRHLHRFHGSGDATVMVDIVHFASPYGLFGRVFDHVILRRYLRRFLRGRANYLRQLAESRAMSLRSPGIETGL